SRQSSCAVGKCVDQDLPPSGRAAVPRRPRMTRETAGRLWLHSRAAWRSCSSRGRLATAGGNHRPDGGNCRIETLRDFAIDGGQRARLGGGCIELGSQARAVVPERMQLLPQIAHFAVRFPASFYGSRKRVEGKRKATAGKLDRLLRHAQNLHVFAGAGQRK